MAVNDFDELEDEILKRMAFKLQNKANENIDNYEINDTGVLRGSSEVSQVRPGTWQVSWNTEYASSIEFGTFPGHMPPLGAIKDWVRRKLQIRDEPRSSRVANSIRWSIFNSGIEGRHFLRDAIDSMRNE